MKVFISSVMRGFEEYRQAVSRAVQLLHHQPIMAEEFGARPESAEKACLGEVASADVVVLILGPSYSGDPKMDPSATEQEYDEAVRLGKQILAFVTKSGKDVRQQKFLAKVQHFKHGVNRAVYDNAEDLKDKVVESLSAFSQKVLPPRSAEDAASLLQPGLSDLSGQVTDTTVVLACVPLHPDVALSAKTMVDREFPGAIARRLMTGPSGVFDLKGGYDEEVRGDAVIIRQTAGYQGIRAYALVGRTGLVVLGKSLSEDRNMGLNADTDSMFLIDQVRVHEVLTASASSIADVYHSVYKSDGQVYIQAALMKMGYKKFGQKSSTHNGSVTMHAGGGADYSLVPIPPESHDLPKNRKSQIALADDLVTLFQWTFKQDGRLV